jgi:hypothetical protein
MNRGWRDHIAAIAFEVYTQSESLWHGAAGVAEVQMASTSASNRLRGVRDRTASFDQFTSVCRPTVPGVAIHNEKAGRGAGRDSDVGIRPPLPPSRDAVLILRGVLEAVRSLGVLAGILAVQITTGADATGCTVQRKHREVVCRVPPRGPGKLSRGVYHSPLAFK